MKYYISAFTAYLLWGLSPLLWKALESFPSLELASYRVILSCIVVIPFLIHMGPKDLWNKLKRKKIITLFSCVFMFTNIFLFVYAVNNGFILEASFGYYLSPLLSIALGYILLKEKISTLKKIAILFAFISVIIRFTQLTTIPYVGLILGTVFTLYGLVRKFSHLSAKELTFIEFIFLTPISLIILSYMYETNAGYILSSSFSEKIILAFAWAGTLLPFLFFSYAIKKLPLNVMGFIQYLAPTSQFLIGIFVFKENINSVELISFIFIWIACTIVLTGNLKRSRLERK